MTPTAAGQVVFPDSPEGLCHALGGATRIPAHPQVFGLERGAALEEAQRASTAARPTMSAPVPREVVEVPLSAREQEARRYRVGLAGLLVTTGAGASLVDETRSLRSEPVRL